ncbi:MAG: glycosyltransferase [Bacteriovorax sp.]|nr:glycosyltransferase [Bacteriovorax sp.]
MSKKNIWILNYQIDDIQSVSNISNNLVALYEGLPQMFYNVLILELQDMEKVSSTSWNHRDWLVRFKETPPHHVIIVHPHVINHIFLSAIMNAQTKFTTQFIFHVFGNFTRHGATWFKLNHLMINKNIQFVAASRCYLELLKNFVAEKNLSILPFPISVPDKDNMLACLPQTLDVLNVLYTGRYHEQKNVTSLLEALGEISAEIDKKIHITLVVYFDDFNPTTLNTQKQLGEQYNLFSNMLNGLHERITVTLVPHTDVKHLYKLYSENDVFMSFSTFLDEDYGCSVIESLSCGTPCIVSKWGGYKDFCTEFPDDCFGADIILEQDGFYIDLSKLAHFIKLISQRTLLQRNKLPQDALAVVGNKKLLDSAMIILSKTFNFSGFDLSLSNFSRDLKTGHGRDTFEGFKRIYKSFWEI